MRAHHDLGVRSNQIGPLRRNRPDGRVIGPQEEASSITVVSLGYTDELFAAEWMERVRDAYKTRPCD